jgi:hypothetical protein
VRAALVRQYARLVASQETLNTAFGLLPKVGAFLLPAAYNLWSRARTRPLLSVTRGPDGVWIRAASRPLIEKLALRITSVGGLSVDSVSCSSKAFAGLLCEQVSATELRASLGRFSEHDAVLVASADPILLETIDSDAVLTPGIPHRLLWLFDWSALLVAVAVLAVFVLNPVEEYLATRNQTQDNVDHELRTLIMSVAVGASSAATLLAGEVLLVPVRRRQALRRRALSI